MQLAYLSKCKMPMKLETNYIIFWRKRRVWLDPLMPALLCGLRIASDIENGMLWFHSYCTWLQERSFFTLINLTCQTLLDLGQNFACYKMTTVSTTHPIVQDPLCSYFCNLNRDENALRTLSFNLVFNLVTLPCPSLPCAENHLE